MDRAGSDFPQGSGAAFEREALHRLEALLGDLLDQPGLTVARAPDEGFDATITDAAERRWLVQAKSTASPAHVAQAARAAKDARTGDGLPLLVVPCMTAGAARAAAERGVNWLDLAGNAHIRAKDLYVHVEGRPNPAPKRGRPATPFAPKSARLTRLLLLDPAHWWRQRDIAAETGLDDGTVSRVVRRLEELELVARDGRAYRPRDPKLLLDAYAAEYRLDRHDIVLAHVSGNGMELARDLGSRLGEAGVEHAFTGLPAAYAMDRFARFRLTSVYVRDDPRRVIDRLDLRRVEKGANVQLIGPNDEGVFAGGAEHDGLACVAPVQAYLDLLHLPERAEEAAAHLRARHLSWDG